MKKWFWLTMLVCNVLTGVMHGLASFDLIVGWSLPPHWIGALAFLYFALDNWKWAHEGTEAFDDRV